MSPYFTLYHFTCVLSPYFFGGRHFCTNAHGIHWMIGTIFVKYSQLILMKIIRPPDIHIGGLRPTFYRDSSFFFLPFLFATYPPSSLNGTQRKSATWSEVNAIWKRMYKILVSFVTTQFKSVTYIHLCFWKQVIGIWVYPMRRKCQTLYVMVKFIFD